MHSTKDNLQVLHEDNHLIIVNKRPGDIVQGDKTGDLPLSEIVKEYIAEKYNKPGAVYLGVVHRLDRPTSGIVVFARTSKALARLNKMFAERETHKTYWAVVMKAPIQSAAKLVHFLHRIYKTARRSFGFRFIPIIDGAGIVSCYDSCRSRLTDFSEASPGIVILARAQKRAVPLKE